MAAQDKTTFEGTFNNSSTGLFKTNTTKDIGSDDLRTLVENITDSVPFNEDDRYIWSFPQVSTSGTNTYAATPSPAITAYSTGQAFKIKFTEASSGASTLNLNGLGAKKLYVNPTTQATTGDIVDEQVYLLIYDAALDTAAGGFLMIGGSGGGGATAAEDVTFTPAGNIAATDVQAALEELDTEKAPLASPTFTGTPAAPTASQGTSTTQLATTAFVTTGLNLKSDILSTFRSLTADHTLDATDLANVNAGDVLEIQMNVAVANSVTIPANATQAFPVGTNIIISQIGAGQTSIVAAVGVTINSANGWVKIAYQYASVVITKTATNTWSIKGTLAA